MSSVIYVEPREVFALFQEPALKYELNPELIAESDELDTKIYLTSNYNYPEIFVTQFGDMVFETGLPDNPYYGAEIVQNVYEEFLDADIPVFDPPAIEPEDMPLGFADDDVVFEEAYTEPFEDFQEPNEYDMEEIDDREAQLESATADFLTAVLCDGEDYHDILAEFQDEALRFLSRKYGFYIYRPMVFEADGGQKFVVEFPYNELD